MASLRDIRKRIRSVATTQKTTKAMKMVSAAKLRRAQERVVGSRPYGIKLDRMITRLAKRAEILGEAPHPLLVDKEHKKNVELIVMTSDRGLCGAFNSSVVRRAIQFLEENKDKYDDIRISCIGKKGYDALKREGYEIRVHHEGVFDNLNIDRAEEIAQEICEHYLEDHLDGAWLIYNEFQSVMTQNLVKKPLLPVHPKDLPETAFPVEHEYEPERHEVLDQLLKNHFAVALYQGLLESQASEHGARMTAMENATRNAGEMVDKLTLQYNRARQAAITTELVEIISGAEAAKAS